MKRASLWLLFFTMAASAQPIVTRLNSEIQALRSLPGLPGGDVLPDLAALTKEERAALRAAVTSRTPDQDRVMLRYADAMSRFYEQPVVPWDLAYALTSVLAGKDLPDDAVTPLNRAILRALDAAFVCRETQSALRKSARFRAALEQTYTALLALDVSAPNAGVVIGGLAKAGTLICDRAPLVRPIPPAYRPLTPRRIHR